MSLSVLYLIAPSYLYEMWEQEGKIKELEKLNILTSYIDWGAIARDWFIDSYFSAKVSYDVTYVFSRH